MNWFENAISFIFKTLLQEIIIIVAGVLFAQFIYARWISWRFGGWRVVVWQDGKEKLDRDISPAKLKEIREEPAELAVFLKGVASPYIWINCDIIKDGEACGLLVIDPDEKTYTLNLDKNPQTKTTRSGERSSELAQNATAN